MEIIDIEVDLHGQPRQQINWKNSIIEIIGWCGSGMILAAYINEFNETTELILNSGGAGGVLLICIQKKALQPILLNIAWIIGSFYKYFFY